MIVTAKCCFKNLSDQIVFKHIGFFLKKPNRFIMPRNIENDKIFRKTREGFISNFSAKITFNRYDGLKYL